MTTFQVQGKGTVGRVFWLGAVAFFLGQGAFAADAQSVLRRMQGAFVNGNHVEKHLRVPSAEDFWNIYIDDQSPACSFSASVRSAVSDEDLMSVGNWVASISFQQADFLLYRAVEVLVALTPEAAWLRPEVRTAISQLNSTWITWGVDSTRKNSCGEPSPFLVAFLPLEQELYGIELRPCVGSD